MTQNPFRGGGTANAYDVPIRPHGTGGGDGGLSPEDAAAAVIVKNGQVNAPGAALVKLINAQMKHEVAKTIAAMVHPYEQRIKALEAALDVERDKVEDAIRSAASVFLGERDNNDLSSGERRAMDATNKHWEGRS